MLAILSFEGDAHLPFVTRHLDRWGVAWTLVPTRSFGAGASVSLRPGAVPAALLHLDGRSLELAGVSAVWNRRLLRAALPHLLADPTVHHYAQEQWFAAVTGALRAMRARWFNNPVALEAARSKPDQLSIASELGLTIPATLVSCDPDEVREFAALHGGALITKVVSPGSPIVAPGVEQYMIFTQRIDPSAVESGAISLAPAIYQPEIKKSFEVRVSVVGDQLFACAIRSQELEQTQLDWRHDEAAISHETADVPDYVAERLLAMCRHYGLDYGMADMIVDEAGEWIFIELNPNGQWAWVEERTGLPIGESIARLLANA